jgi:aminoglycoside 3-N-acetyltransferase
MTIQSVRLRPLVTCSQMVRDLRLLGVKEGETLLVHASMRSIGSVAGGARTVVAALREAVGPEGNVVTPTATEENSSTSRAHRARILGMTPEEARTYRELMPAFDRDRTASGLGAVSEALRTARGAVRSDHPQSSFAAIGRDAEFLMADHRLESHLGEDSPLGKLEKMRARVLLIGVGYRVCTAFHLAEYRYRPSPPLQTYACVVTGADGRRRWVSYQDVVLDDREFEVMGQSMEWESGLLTGNVGNAFCRLAALPFVVSFAADWLSRARA